VKPVDRIPVTQQKGDSTMKKLAILALAAMFTFSLSAVASPFSNDQDQPKKEEKKDEKKDEKKPAPKPPQ